MFNKKFLSFLLLIGLILTILSIVPFSKADNPPPIKWTQWTKTYGGTNYESAYSMIQTNDDGYALAGTTRSFYGDIEDFWLVKTDAYGNQEWNKTYGGVNFELTYCVIQTNDDGYALVGIIKNSSSRLVGEDIWLVKTDTLGNMKWNKTYNLNGSSGTIYDFIQTNDNGYALAIIITNPNSPVGQDIWLVKTDTLGNVEWNKTFVRMKFNDVYSLIQTSDGGYALAGDTSPIGLGSYDFWLVKIDAYGNEEWNRTYGLPYDQSAHSIIQINDGGYVLAGSTGAGFKDFWLVKTDSLGNMEWNKTYGGIDDENAWSVIQTKDDGYALVGYTDSFGAGFGDFWLVKTDVYGNLEWSKTFGGTRLDNGRSIVQTKDNTFVLAGTTYSFGAGNTDFWLIKVVPTLITLNSVGGQLYPSPSSYISPLLEDTAWIIAHPDSGYKFSHFLIDGIVTPAQYIEEDGDYTYYLIMDASHVVQAVFTVDVPVFPTLTVLDSLGGQIYPQPGNYIPPNLEDAAWLIAHPTPGYKFNYFFIDGIITSNQYFEEDGDYTYYLIMDTSHSVQAIFVPS